jgi:hypothetical protein
VYDKCVGEGQRGGNFVAGTRAKLHFSAGGVMIVVTMTINTTDENTPRSTTG